MPTSNHKRLNVSPVAALVAINAQVNVLEGTSEALAWQDTDSMGHNADWTYSAAAESNGGEPAITDVIEDLDDEPGLIYVGTSGASVHVNVTGLDVSAGPEAPGAAEETTVGVFLNNTLVATADEGVVIEFDAVTAEFNISAYIENLQNTDVVRVGLIALEGNTDATTYAVAEGAVISIS